MNNKCIWRLFRHLDSPVSCGSWGPLMICWDPPPARCSARLLQDETHTHTQSVRFRSNRKHPPYTLWVDALIVKGRTSDLERKLNMSVCLLRKQLINSRIIVTVKLFIFVALRTILSYVLIFSYSVLQLHVETSLRSSDSLQLKLKYQTYDFILIYFRTIKLPKCKTLSPADPDQVIMYSLVC